eukprot:756159-Pyramimonas_sp.AAC.2
MERWDACEGRSRASRDASAVFVRIRGVAGHALDSWEIEGTCSYAQNLSLRLLRGNIGVVGLLAVQVASIAGQ